MARQTVITRKGKRRGPAPTGVGVLIGVRFQPDALARLDKWAASHAPSRPEAIRRLVERGLKAEPTAEKTPRHRS